MKTQLLPRIILLLWAALSAYDQAAWAATPTPPDSMTYQGFLVDANGTPLAQATPQNYPVAFRIYTASSGGTNLWAEQQIVTVDKGSFSVVLGEGTPIGGEPRPALSSIFTGPTASDRYISVWVTISGSTTEILPRLRLVPSPYSFLATSAANLVQPNGSAVVSYSSGQVNITGNVIASGTISGNGSGLTGLTPGQIPALDASKITTGTFSDARIPTTLTGNRSFTGNLGIGTTAPNERLQVGDFSNPDQYIMTATSGGNAYRTGIKLRHFNTDYGWTLESDERDSSFRIFSHFGDPVGVTRLFMDRFSGNLGLNTTTPGFPLTFPNVLGDKISLWGQSGANYGFGIQGSLLQIHSDSSGADIAFGYGSSGGMTETVRIKGNGLVGFGTSTPADHLHMRGGVFRLDDAASEYIRMYRSANGLIIEGNGMGNPGLPGGNGAIQWDGDGNWDSFSDRRLKKDVADAESVLGRLMQLPVRRYRWKDAEEDTPARFGVIAQEVQPLFPESVGSMTQPGETNEMMTVKYGTFGLIAVKALQELKTEKDAERAAFQQEISDLKKEVERLKSRPAEGAQVENLQRELKELKQIVQQLATARNPAKTAAGGEELPASNIAAVR